MSIRRIRFRINIHWPEKALFRRLFGFVGTTRVVLYSTIWLVTTPNSGLIYSTEQACRFVRFESESWFLGLRGRSAFEEGNVWEYGLYGYF